MKIFYDKQIELDLNGPILSFTTEPTGVTGIGTTVGSTGGATVSVSGEADATFPTSADNTGIITYRWYEQGVGALSDSTYITGTATTTLTLSNLITPTDNQRKFYLQADYIPPYTGTTATYTTGNAINEPFNSGIATITVTPMIEIIAQPTSQTTLIDDDVSTYDTGKFLTLSVNSDLTDSYFTDDLTYQWFIDGVEATDGTLERTTTTSDTQSGIIEETFTSPATYEIGSLSGNVDVTLAGGQGGRGGNDSGGQGGRGAQGRAARFIIPQARSENNTLQFYIGTKGNDGTSGGPSAGGSAGSNRGPTPIGDGGNGGGAGQNGWSGGGGGGGAASYLSINGNTVIVSAGGGGGGGGSLSEGGDSGYNRNPGVGLGYGQGNVSELRNAGQPGQTKNGDGGGGGGGGGGAPRGPGGPAGQDNSHGGRAGGGGASAQNTAWVTRQGPGWLHEGDGYGFIKYTGTTTVPTTTVRKTRVEGSTTANLKVACDMVGVQTAQCKISSVTASNSYVLTDEINAVFVSSAAQNNIRIEAIGVTADATLSDINLNNGEYTFNLEGTDADNNGINQFYSFYSNEKDMEVEMDLYGGKGRDFSDWAAGMGWGEGFAGGEGGFARIRLTLTQDKEYVIAGLISSVNTPFLYQEGTLIACVGQGGDGGRVGRGGFGGGVDVDGEDGRGRLSGEGGKRGWPEFHTANMGGGPVRADGVFGSSFTAPIVYPGDLQSSGYAAGRSILCTKGVYWRDQGIGACDTTTTKFRLSDGTEVSNTMTLTRGFKAGYNIMQTAGNNTGSEGGEGGNGANGGWGASSGGGGGGSGFAQNCTVVSTQLGGSTGNAKVVLRVVT